MSESYNATVVITTKNRRDELRNALRSTLTQEGLRLEVIVIDDGSTDGTADMVGSEFPSVRLERFEESRGLIARRNHAAKIASGPVIVSIDDDAEFSASDTVAQVLGAFANRRVGAVAMPYVDCVRDDAVRSAAPDGQHLYATGAYTGTAHAIRRDLFLELGGYREELIYGGEESDYCLRMLNHGYVTILGRTPPILHHESPRRPSERGHVFRARGTIMRTIWNVPWPHLPLHLLGATVSLLRVGAVTRHPLWIFKGLAKGYYGAWKTRRLRRPVRRSVYRAYRNLPMGMKMDDLLRAVGSGGCPADCEDKP